MPGNVVLSDIALESAEAAVKVVAGAWNTTTSTELKGVVDPVTEVDRAAEAAIMAVLTERVPDDGVRAEEGSGRPSKTGRTWLVDPLDGTVNFVHRLPHVAVSVAVWHEQSPLAGAVIDVTRSLAYVAEATAGAACNGQPMAVSDTAGLRSALVATGFPYDRDVRGRDYARTMGEVLVASQGVRRQGSAALDFAAVAAGTVDAYYEFGLSPWDGAAGALLVQEAGGQVTDHLGKPYHLESPSVVATNGRIHDELLSLLTDNLPTHLRTNPGG